jgi:hypothetical protein
MPDGFAFAMPLARRLARAVADPARQGQDLGGVFRPVRDQRTGSRVCFPSADYEAFRRETLAQYETNPEFLEGCRLSG